MQNKFYRINLNIRAPELRVIGADGKQIGILKLADALAKAHEEGVDVVEIAATAKPPVAKLIDFNKFLYAEDKKERKSKRGVRGGEIKEIRFSPFIAKGDLDFRIKRIKEFIGESNKVRVVVRFHGRQMTKKEFGYGIVKQVRDAVEDVALAESDPKWMGPNLIITFTPIKKDHAKKQDENSGINRETVQSN